MSDSATPWIAACQPPLSVGISRQEYWTGLPFPSPGDLPTQGLNPGFLSCKQILYCLSHQGKISSQNCFHCITHITICCIFILIQFSVQVCVQIIINIIFWHVDVHLFLHHLLQKNMLHCIGFAHLLKISCLYLCGSISDSLFCSFDRFIYSFTSTTLSPILYCTLIVNLVSLFSLFFFFNSLTLCWLFQIFSLLIIQNQLVNIHKVAKPSFFRLLFSEHHSAILLHSGGCRSPGLSLGF